MARDDPKVALIYKHIMKVQQFEERSKYIRSHSPLAQADSYGQSNTCPEKYFVGLYNIAF